MDPFPEVQQQASCVFLQSRENRVIKTSVFVCPPDQETGNSQVIFMQLDLASLQSVRSFAENFLRSESRLDLLINNAGQLPCSS